jgi:GntR family transcriptional repressor for pyruvate dehydrogenase complex
MSEPFQQLSREPTLAERVANSILERIRSGELKPGDKLPSERELGDQFGVSRTVVREAVSELTGRGMVSVRAGSGLRVAAVDPAAFSESLTLMLRHSDAFDYRHVHEVRAMLEVQMAGVAAVRATADDITSLEAAAGAMEGTSDVDEAAQCDLEFHRAIANATHNPLYLVLHDAIGEALMDVRRANLSHGGGEEAATSHRSILARIAAHDRAAAEEAMRSHLEAVEMLWEATS